MYNIKDIQNIIFLLNDRLLLYKDKIYYPIILELKDINLSGLYCSIILVDIKYIFDISIGIKNVILNNRNYNNKNNILKKVENIKKSLKVSIIDNKIYICDKEAYILKMYMEYTDDKNFKKYLQNKLLKKSSIFNEIIEKQNNFNYYNKSCLKQINKIMNNNYITINNNPMVLIKIDSSIK